MCLELMSLVSLSVVFSYNRSIFSRTERKLSGIHKNKILLANIMPF